MRIGAIRQWVWEQRENICHFVTRHQRTKACPLGAYNRQLLWSSHLFHGRGRALKGSWSWLAARPEWGCCLWSLAQWMKSSTVLCCSNFPDGKNHLGHLLHAHLSETPPKTPESESPDGGPESYIFNKCPGDSRFQKDQGKSTEELWVLVRNSSWTFWAPTNKVAACHQASGGIKNPS